MLELKDLRAGYGDHEVLHGLSYSFKDGKNYCLLGPNGCGKTTLLRAMAALIPFTGSVTVDGQELVTKKRLEIAREVALLSQVSHVYFPYTVWDTVMLGRYQHIRSRLFSRASAEDKEMVEACLRRVRLLDEKDRRIDELSGGQMQRVFLAQVLAQDPRYILLDEPTNHLDIRHQLGLIEHLQEWTADGTHSVIGVFHDINLALHLSENVLLMKDGHFIATGTFDEVADAKLLAEIYETDITGFMKESLSKWETLQ